MLPDYYEKSESLDNSKDFIKLEFHVSPSKFYEKALSLLRKFSDYSEAQTENSMNTLLVSELELYNKYNYFYELYVIVHDWKKTQVYIQGKPLAHYMQLRKIFDKMERMIKDQKDLVKDQEFITYDVLDHLRLANGEKNAHEMRYNRKPAKVMEN